MPKISDEPVKKTKPAVKPVAKTVTPAKQKPKKSLADRAAGRPVVYDKIGTTLYAKDTKAGPITADLAKQWLGWKETDNGEFSKEIHNLTEQKVILEHNIINRPIYQNRLVTLRQEHLRNKWRLNMEPVIFGKTGLVLNGQHCLISLICAVNEWKKDDKWRENWPTEPTMDKLVCVGVDESDDVVNTLDTCKPRSLWEVIYRSAHFADMAKGARRQCAKICQKAIHLLWPRTGNSKVQRTHAEVLDFLSRHQRLLEAVKHIAEEDLGEEKGKGRINRYIDVGHAAGLLYLMGASETDPSNYYGSDIRDESGIDFVLWDKACDFWVGFAGGEKSLSQIKKTIAAMVAALEGGKLSRAERCAVFVKAWLNYYANKPVTEASLKLEYAVDKNGVELLAENYIVGGIDIGDPDDVATPVEQPTEVAVVKSVIKGLKTPKQKKQKAPLKVGDTVWVIEEGDEPWQGILNGISDGSEGKVGNVEVATGFAGAGNSYDVRLSIIQHEQPEG